MVLPSARLRTIARFELSTLQNRMQYDLQEYELPLGSHFEGFGHKVSVVDTTRPSRFQQRVEFMVGYKWRSLPQQRTQILCTLKGYVFWRNQ